MINVAIYDEHRLGLEGTARLLKDVSDISVLFSCGDKTTLKEKLKVLQVHILLLTMHDISVKKLNLIVQLTISFPKLRILVLSIINNEEIILKTLKAGAKGFLGKESDQGDMVEAIYTLRNGFDYYGKSLTNLVLNRYIKNLKDHEPATEDELSSLSDRQIEILKLWGKSYSNQEIADNLFISVRTVESHKNHIMQKLNLKSTVDLVKFGIKNNIIEI
jgi:two-component system response regulator NreC